MTERTQNSLCWLLCFLVGCVLVGFLSLPAWAKGDYPESANKTWYESQYNSNHQYCCTEADAHPYYDEYTLNQDGSAELIINGQKVYVEAYKVLHDSNPTGHAVVWYLGSYTYCFAPGTLM